MHADSLENSRGKHVVRIAAPVGLPVAIGCRRSHVRGLRALHETPVHVRGLVSSRRSARLVRRDRYQPVPAFGARRRAERRSTHRVPARLASTAPPKTVGSTPIRMASWMCGYGVMTRSAGTRVPTVPPTRSPHPVRTPRSPGRFRLRPVSGTRPVPPTTTGARTAPHTVRPWSDAVRTCSGWSTTRTPAPPDKLSRRSPRQR